MSRSLVCKGSRDRDRDRDRGSHILQGFTMFSCFHHFYPVLEIHHKRITKALNWGWCPIFEAAEVATEIEACLKQQMQEAFGI